MKRLLFWQIWLLSVSIYLALFGLILAFFNQSSLRKPVNRTILIFLFSLSRLTAQNDFCLYHTTLGISFPPVADDEQRTFTEKHLDRLGATKIRFAEEWAFREPTPGDFNWAPLDGRINWADDNNYDILLTIQANAPDWACSSIANEKSCVFKDNADFKRYLDLLLQRYAGKIDKIQFGNEWQSDFWYAGTARDFIAANNTLYQSVQTYSPSTKVVLGGFTAISLRFLAGCSGYVDSFYDGDGNYYDAASLAARCASPEIQKVKSRIDSVLTYARYDLLDIHLYDDVEQWDEYYACFSAMVAKPIIVSEFGGPNMNYEPYSQSYQADRIYQYIRKLDSLKIPEIYFFKLVEGTANPAHATSGLIADTTLTEKPAYDLFALFHPCPATVVDVDSTDKGVFIFPNPAREFVIIQRAHPDKLIREVAVYDLTGGRVETIENINDNRYELHVRRLANGIYFLRIVTSRGCRRIEKMAIVR